MNLETSTLTTSARGRGQDVVGVELRVARCVIALGDGAGGSGGGLEAATRVVHSLLQHGLEVERPSEEAWRRHVLELAVEMEALGAGQSTALAITIEPSGRLCGASVGDSEAVILGTTGAIELTEGQQRKPLLGAGVPRVWTFSGQLSLGETLVVASDGLWKYVARAALLSSLEGPLSQLCGRLTDLARLPSGGLNDDVGIAVVRVSTAFPTALREALGSTTELTADLLDELEAWLALRLRLGRSTDGVKVDAHATLGARVQVTGWLIGVDSQRWQPFALDLDGEHWKLSYGLPDSAGLTETKLLSIGATREWAIELDSLDVLNARAT